MDTQRLILFFIFGFSLLMLWDAWEKEHRPKPAPQVSSSAAVPTPAAQRRAAIRCAAPQLRPRAAARGPTCPAPLRRRRKGETIVVRTDLLVAEIDTLGGDAEAASSCSSTRKPRIRPRIWCCSGRSTTTRRRAV